MRARQSTNTFKRDKARLRTRAKKADAQKIRTQGRRARFLAINGTDIPKIIQRMKKTRMTGQKIQYTRNHKCIERNRGSPRRRKSSSLGLVISPCSMVEVTTTSSRVPLLTLGAPHCPQNAPDT